MRSSPRLALGILAVLATGLGLAGCGAAECLPGPTDPAREVHGLYAVDLNGGSVESLRVGAEDAVLSPDWSRVVYDFVPDWSDFGEGGADADIFVAEPPGGEGRNLTYHPAMEIAPSWSPDGSSIAFSRNADIWTMEADGSGRRLVADTGLLDHGPVWLPDGRIAFFSFPTSGEGPDRFFTVRPDGSGLTPLPWPDRNVPLSSLAWSPDAMRIAFVRYGGPGTSDPVVYVADADWSHERKLASGFDPAWSPDGRTIALAVPAEPCDGAQLAVVDADGSDLRALTSGAGTALWPTWSPDGRRIAFVGGPPPVPID
jgi:TolB protein